jgi:hypothetical protein
MRSRRPLFAALVGICALVALVVASLRAPDAVLSATFARACAVEAAATNRSHTGARVDREHGRGGDVRAVPVSVESAKTSAPVRERAFASGFRLASLSTIAITVPRPRESAGPGARWSSTDPPTRARARLMVFLN